MKSKLAVCVRGPPLGPRLSQGLQAFLERKKYFWLPRVASDVTSISSSCGLGSGLAPEILTLSCCSVQGGKKRGANQ